MNLHEVSVMNKMNIKGAIFDVDGTLINSLIFWDDFYKRLQQDYFKDREFVFNPELDKKCRTQPEAQVAKMLHESYGVGKDSDEMHREIGRYFARAGVDALYTLGENGALIAESAIEAGVSTVFAEKQSDGYESLAKEIRAAVQAGDVILFKASRAMALEKLIALLFEE